MTKKLIRDFYLSLNMRAFQSASYEEQASFSFDAWFKLNIVNIYLQKIPQTIQYLCDKLEVENEYVTKVI